MKVAVVLGALILWSAPSIGYAQSGGAQSQDSGDDTAQAAADAATTATLRPTAPGTAPNRLSDGRPGYGVLRQDEDWSVLADASRRSDALDGLKYVPLSQGGESWLSLGADAYVSARTFTDETFGAVRGTDPTGNTRLNVHASLHLGERVRLYGALKHGDQYWRESPVGPPNRDRLDLHQAFAEFAFGEAVGGQPHDVFVRVGRQELHYGGGRLISARLGPNVRNDYDGLLLRARAGGVTVDAFGFRGVTDEPGVFDNGRDRAEDLWGLYGSTPLGRVNLDLIYIGQARERSGYANVVGLTTETRHTLGVRIATGAPLDGWSLDLEGAYQFGDASPVGARQLNINAWTVAGVISKAFSEAPLEPVVGLEFGLTSGDRDAADGRLGTFRAPAAPGRYFGEANPFGPGNIAGFRPYVDLTLTENLTLRPKVAFLWRMTEADGLYTLAPSVLRRATAGNRFLGAEPGLELTYSLGTHWTLSAFAAHFFTGPYFRSSQPGRDVNYLELTLAFRL